MLTGWYVGKFDGRGLRHASDPAAKERRRSRALRYRPTCAIHNQPRWHLFTDFCFGCLINPHRIGAERFRSRLLDQAKTVITSECKHDSDGASEEKDTHRKAGSSLRLRFGLSSNSIAQ